MIYLDANVFLYAALYAGSKAEKARTLLADVRDGHQTAVTASLTVDEVVWAAGRHSDRRTGIGFGEDILEMGHLRILNVGADDVRAALAFMKEYTRLSPRDAVHAAVAWNAGVFTIASDDTDFDVVREIERWPL